MSTVMYGDVHTVTCHNWHQHTLVTRNVMQSSGPATNNNTTLVRRDQNWNRKNSSSSSSSSISSSHRSCSSVWGSNLYDYTWRWWHMARSIGKLFTYIVPSAPLMCLQRAILPFCWNDPILGVILVDNRDLSPYLTLGRDMATWRHPPISVCIGGRHI